MKCNSDKEEGKGKESNANDYTEIYKNVQEFLLKLQ